MTVKDHIQLGRELDIFTTDPSVGTGLPLWLPAGAAVRQQLDRFIVDLEQQAGYQHVMTPQLGKRQLYEQSGHWDFFNDDMFPTMQVGHEQMVLRPVNCPHHVLVYTHAERIYRDLPLRIAELGTMYRMERSGVVGGLSRVRAMTLNDAHVFCQPGQVAAEIDHALTLIDRCYAALGMTAYSVRLSRRTDQGKWAGDKRTWQAAETALADALRAHGTDYVDAPGEAAFYGPKIDVDVQTVKGGSMTLSTVQVDMWMPDQFDLTFTESGGGKARPVMLHRSILSTAERLMSFLLELYQGSFPYWLAPIQVSLIPVDQGQGPDAAALAATLRARGIRCVVDDGPASVSSRIRTATLRHVPVVALLGPREVAAGTVSVRTRDGLRADGLSVSRVQRVLVDAADAQMTLPVF
ncbi:threonine--tRNA ligase [soil metagenome]